MKVRQLKVLTTACILATGVSSCGVSNTHHIRTGEDPRYQDKDVAFRTTYYFRVFDPCRELVTDIDKEQYKKAVPEFSSLYRFTMTGKSNTLLNKVLFESGTLKTWEIDPLGANVIYDEGLKRFRYVSSEETQSKAQQEQAWAEYNRLMDEYKKVKAESEKQDTSLTALSLSIAANVTDITREENNPLYQAASSNSTQNYINNIGNGIEQFEKLLAENNASLHDNIKTSSAAAVHNTLNTIHQTTSKKLTNIADKVLYNKIKDKAAEHAFKQLKTKLQEDKNLSILIDTDKFETFIKNLPEYSAIVSNEFEEKLTENITSKAGAILSNINAQDASKKPLLTKVSKSYVNESSRKALLKSKDTPLKKLLGEGIDNVRRSILSGIAQLTNTKQENISNLAITELEPKFDQLEVIVIDRFKIYFSDQYSDLNALNKAQFSGQVLTEPSYNEITLRALNKNHINEQLNTQLLQVINKEINKFSLSAIPNSVLSNLEYAIRDKLAIATNTLPKSQLDKLEQSVTPTKIECSKDKQLTEHKGFQILGPEGWRTLNQNERLVMAMHTSNEPMLNNLKELSQRVLNAQQQKAPSVLPLVQAQLKASKAQYYFDIQSQPINQQQEAQTSVETICNSVNEILADFSAATEQISAVCQEEE